MKSSSLAYNRRETRDKRPLGAAAHVHESMGCEQESGGDNSSSPGPYPTIACPEILVENFSPCPYAAADAHGVMGCDQKTLSYRSVAVTQAPIRVPTQRPLVPSFTQARTVTFHLVRMLPPMSIE